MITQQLNANHLTTSIKNRLDQDFDEFPTEVTTVFGQQLQIVDEAGFWCSTLYIEHVGYGVKKIRWGKRFYSDDYIEWIVRSWILDRIRTRIDLGPTARVISELPTLKLNDHDAEKIEEAVFQWIRTNAIDSAASGNGEKTIGMRLLYRWCLEEDLPGFSEYRQLELDNIAIPHVDNKHLVSMRDVTDGPYTRVELSLLEASLKTPQKASATQRALFLLGRDWGLRPIQIALLRIDDFGRDELGPFIMVPSVKGIKRSRLRRSLGNLVKRYISDDTADAVEVQSKLAPEQAYETMERAIKIVKENKKNERNIPMPLFPNKYRSEQRLRRFCDNPKLEDFVLHSDSTTISKLLRDLTWQLHVISPRKSSDFDGEAIIEVSAYRLRRTKGTMMVLSGATPEEVAEALDHKGVDSIKHYFRYNLDLHDFINRIHASSPEIEIAIQMWNGRFEGDQPSHVGDLQIGSLGKCTLGSACSYHPLVSCYACQSFRPDRSADHSSALQNIEEFQKLIAASSTGPIAQQLESAIFGAKAIIIAIAGS